MVLEQQQQFHSQCSRTAALFLLEPARRLAEQHEFDLTSACKPGSQQGGKTESNLLPQFLKELELLSEACAGDDGHAGASGLVH